VVLVIFNGPDLGEFGDKPFQELAKDLAPGLPLELFFDASKCIGPTVNVSSEWAQWMITYRTQLYRVNLLCGSRYVEVTANFVRRFTEFGERMRIYSDHNAFYQALSVGAGKSAFPVKLSFPAVISGIRPLRKLRLKCKYGKFPSRLSIFRPRWLSGSTAG
jgi:hypothetical protein